MVIFMPHVLYSWEMNPQYPSDRRLGGPQAGFEAVEKIINCSSTGNQALSHPDSSLVTVLFIYLYFIL
jgi:hypothetical protein